MYFIDIQNWDPLSVLYTKLAISSIPKNQYCKSLQCKSLSAEKAYVVTSYSDGTVITFSVEKINNRIEIHTIDKFNMIEMHMLKTDDNNVKEMYGNLSKFKSLDCIDKVIDIDEATFNKEKLKNYILSSNEDLDRVNFFSKICLYNYKITDKKEFLINA